MSRTSQPQGVPRQGGLLVVDVFLAVLATSLGMVESVQYSQTGLLIGGTSSKFGAWLLCARSLISIVGNSLL
jgi:hypothetical protein